MTKFEEELNKIEVEVQTPLDKYIVEKAASDESLYAQHYEAVLEKFKDWHSDEQYQTAKRMVEHVQVENEMLKAKLKSQQQALPVVPKDVAKLPPFDDMKEYVLDERLLTIREYLNKLDDKSNNDITEAEAWCLTHEHIVYRAMLDGYTVEKPQLFYLKNKMTGFYLFRAFGGKYGEQHQLREDEDFKFTQQEIDSMQTGSYEQIKVEEG